MIDWSNRGDFASSKKHTAMVELKRHHRTGQRRERRKGERVPAGRVQGQEHAGRHHAHQLTGGSPVQAQTIYDEMRRLRKKYPDIPLYAVVEDICASGGYFVAVGADRIYVGKASIVGSIGVLMNGFGFTGLMDKLGVERRLITAGKNKGMLDPFSPLEEKDKTYITGMMKDIHDQFIGAVREGRGKRLKETPDTFSGSSGPARRAWSSASRTATAASTPSRAM